MSVEDRTLIELFLEPVRKCAEYKPAFGQGNSDGLTIADFQTLYGQDPFYAWIGLDDPLLYVAHKAAGGLTSVYRQVGVGSERLLRAIIMDSLGLASDQIDWRYNYPKEDKKQGVHILDAKISFSDLSPERKQLFEYCLLRSVILWFADIVVTACWYLRVFQTETLRSQHSPSSRMSLATILQPSLCEIVRN